MGEVETQVVRCDQRAGLVDVITQDLRRAACKRCVAVWLRARFI